jgi:hypothetical protein
VFNRFEPFVVLEYLQEPILGSPRAPSAASNNASRSVGAHRALRPWPPARTGRWMPRAMLHRMISGRKRSNGKSGCSRKVTAERGLPDLPQHALPAAADPAVGKFA